MKLLRSSYAFMMCALVATAACGGGEGSSPTAPSPGPGPTPAPTPVVINLTGSVLGSNNARLSGATVRILDGANAGKIAQTNSNGEYRFENLTSGNANLSATASGYEEGRAGVFINGTSTLNITLRPVLFSRSGAGDMVFDMPRHVTRVKITGDYSGYSSNYIVYIGGRLIVNELIGSGWGQRHFEGVYQIPGGGTTEITHSSGVAWSFTEVR